jgi:AraC-like DNA-binding protein
VSFIHRRDVDASEFNAFFGSDVTFGAEVDEVAFSKSSKDLPIVGADSYLNELLVEYCEQALVTRTKLPNSFQSDVENVIALLLPHGDARVHEVARKLGVSRRTLARRLASEGLTFAGVLQNLKADLANAIWLMRECPFQRLLGCSVTKVPVPSLMPLNVGPAPRLEHCAKTALNLVCFRTLFRPD